MTSQSSQKLSVTQRQKVLAEAYAAELLELFRSLSPAQLKTYLGKNPITTSIAATDLYPLCSHINLIDRVNSTATKTIILNADPLATLPATASTPRQLKGCDAKDVPNRFYQIQVVSLSTNLNVVAAACGKSPSIYVLAADERYQVNVGVSWLPCGGDQKIQSVMLSTLLPG